MSITVKCDGGADVVLYKTELEEFAQEIFKTQVGIRSLTKLGLAVGYEYIGGNGSRRARHFLIELTPMVRQELKTMTKTRDKGIMKAIRVFNVVIFLQRISASTIPVKRQVFEYMGCALLRNGVVIDTIMAKAVGPNAYRKQTTCDSLFLYYLG